MPILEGRELRIVGFLCNWCSYGGADTAGVGRLAQPTDLRIIRVPCSGRIDPLFIVKAFMNGADGVLVSGCHPRDCHYAQGNYYARRRLEVLKRFLPVMGINDARFEYTWVSASEGRQWQKVVKTFTERIHALGPAPGLDDSDSLSDACSICAVSPEKRDSRVPSSPGFTGNSKSCLAEFKKSLRTHLPDLDLIIGWGEGYDALHNTPLFIRTPEDVEKLILGPLNVHNLVTYLPSFRNKKVGVVVKGCDSRSVVELMQENLIDRDKVMIFSVPCTGVIDHSKVDRMLRGKGTNIGRVEGFAVSGDVLKITVDVQSYSMTMADVAADKCLDCQYPKALLSDIAIGEHSDCNVSGEQFSSSMNAASSYATTLGEPERTYTGGISVSSAERSHKDPSENSDSAQNSDSGHKNGMRDIAGPEDWIAFWRYHVDRCTRCYACRNACPLCVCRDHCVATSRDPEWVSQDHTMREKLMFLVIHAIHLAGRCTECGECQRACPMGIPLLELKRGMNAIVRELFEYSAGTDPEAIPPLLMFQAEEAKIMERGW